MDNFSKFIFKDVCDALETYRGRDKILRTLCYSTKLIGGLANNKKVAKGWLNFSSQMSAARAVLRLLDDLPVLKHNLEYGFGKEEPDQFMATVGIINNIIDQLYFPIDKIAWLAEHKCISIRNVRSWEIGSCICWVITTYLMLMKSIRYLNILKQRKSSVDAKTDEREFKQLSAMEQMELLSIVRISVDLIHAISCLPRGFLWSSKLKPWQVGFVGTVSSFIGLYQLFAKRALK